MTQTDQIARTVKDFILRQFLPGEDADALSDSTPLITGGILDSIGTIQLVSFLETQYGVQFEAHEISPEHLDTIAAITATVGTKGIK